MKIKLSVDHHTVELDTPQNEWFDALMFEGERFESLMANKTAFPFFEKRRWDSERQITVIDE